jgi:hypothetical protein
LDHFYFISLNGHEYIEVTLEEAWILPVKK